MKEIKFIDVGEGITEGQLRKWLVKNLEQVKEDQPVVQIETDKAVVNLPSPISGTIKIVAGENATVKVGDIIAYVGEGSELSAAQPQSSSPQLQKPPAPTQTSAATQPKTTVQQSTTQIPSATQIQKAPTTEIIAPPSVRKLARDLSVDISKVTGTGPGGRITENDIRALGSAIQKKAVPKFSNVLEEKHADEIVRLPMSQTRKAIARNMELSATIPRAVHMDMINASVLFNIVQKEKKNLEALEIKLTFLPFIAKAVIEALKENPRFNSSYDHETSEIIVKKYYNIGIAAEAPDGLKVLVLKNADKKSIAQLAKELQTLAQKIKDQTITLEEMSDSTFTITNIGSLGGGFLSVPMINYPEVGILGIHKIKDTPIVEEGVIKVAKVLPFSIAFDHRVVDGADAARFGNTLIKYLEDPDFLEILG